MVPERSMKIPELGSAASAHHSVMELRNGTFGNESSCQSLFVRFHNESILFLRGLVSSVWGGEKGGVRAGNGKVGEGGQEMGKWEGGGKRKGDGQRKGGKGEMGKGRAERGKGVSGKGER